MSNFPIFLLPKGDIMITAQIEGQELKLLKKTLFPSGNRYYISDHGLAACIDCEKKIILYGKINYEGGLDYIKIIPFPSIISPKSLCIIKNNIVLGGENIREIQGISLTKLAVISYSIVKEEIIALDMPFDECGFKRAVDLLVENNKVTVVVDDIFGPNYLLEYDFSEPDHPFLIKSNILPDNSTLNKIRKGATNENIIALLSYSLNDEEIFINIFKKGCYNDYTSLHQRNDLKNKNEITDKKGLWGDIYFLPKQNILLISSNEDGIGIYPIESDKINQQNNVDANSIYYLNSWNKKVIKILSSPIDSENLILVFEEGYDDNVKHSYEIKSIEYFLSILTDNGAFEKVYSDKIKEYEEKDCSDEINKCEEIGCFDEIPNYDKNNEERDYFDAMTDGQYGDYDDFEGNIDDIDTRTRG